MDSNSKLCVDIGGTRIKYAVLTNNADLIKLKLYHKRTLGWLNQSFSDLFSKNHWAGILKEIEFDSFNEIAVCVPGPIPDGSNFERYDLIKRGMPQDLKTFIEKTSGKPAILIKDADAWALGIENFMSLSNENLVYPILTIVMGTGVGISYIKDPGKINSLEIVNAPPRLSNLSNAAGKNINESWHVHRILGDYFFHWVSENRNWWSYDKIRHEYTHRAIAFIKDLQTILPENLKTFNTIIAGGGNSEFLSVRTLQEKLNKKVIVFSSQAISVNPDIIPLLGLNRYNTDFHINRSPWN